MCCTAAEELRVLTLKGTSVANEGRQHTAHMLRSAVRRVASQFRRSPQQIDLRTLSRSARPSKNLGFIGLCGVQQRLLLADPLLLLRTFSSTVESRNGLDALGAYKRKAKILLEPSRFDGATTFEQAFGRQVIAWLLPADTTFLPSLQAHRELARSCGRRK
jgi:hypothetical protein